MMSDSNINRINQTSILKITFFYNLASKCQSITTQDRKNVILFRVTGKLSAKIDLSGIKLASLYHVSLRSFYTLIK